MITVNLRPNQKRKRAGSSFQGVMQGVRGMGSKIKDPLLLLAVASWVAVLGWLGFVVLGTSRDLNALEPQLESTRAENKRFKSFLTEKRHQETIRDSLVAQIAVIRHVDGDRYVWSHVLDEVTKALPAYTWLIDVGTASVAAPGTAPAAPASAAQKPAASKAADSAANAPPAPSVIQFEV